jgi:hypothetical protein
MITVTKKIVAQQVIPSPTMPITQYTAEKRERPELLRGTTYKLKTPLSDHALYITINDIVLNAGSEHETQHPFEMFINSKEMANYQWIVALTRVVSAVFRNGGDVTFLVEELRSVFDPKGGYFKKGGRYMPSLVAEIGDVLEQHLQSLGCLTKESDKDMQQYIAEKRAAIAMNAQQSETSSVDTLADDSSLDAATDSVAEGSDTVDSKDSVDIGYVFPKSCTQCPKCHYQAVAVLDGCATCLNCGDSKCG